MTNRHFFIIEYLHLISQLEANIDDIENKQKLYGLLKSQHQAEVQELMHYMSVLTTVQHQLVRNYLHTLLSDGIKHIEIISSIMANIEGATASARLTSKGLEESISEEKESKAILLKCVDLSQDTETRELLTSIVVDEEHHIRILEHISQMMESFSGKSTM
jgi:rubrerythrin